MTPTLTALYAAPLALIYLWLSIRVIAYRRSNLISLGDKGDPELLQRMRAQGNCGEYVPIGVILLLIAELGGTPPWALHLLGVMLLVGRAAHGWGFSRSHLSMGPRVLGMVLTLSALAYGAALCLWVALT